ncbi:MAG: ATP-dependent chaperone ClpB, partial [Proteobacteria bacterium]|nr:ATP-dependent chaperone ClpB [Pseudomonadota bacterium]
MNIEKYTDRAKGFVQAAQNLALREGHQQLAPEHLLKVLLDDPEGMCAGLIDKAGGDSTVARASNERTLAKRPKVSGGNGQVYLSPELARILDQAEKIADKAGDKFVTVERLLVAMAVDGSSEAARALKDAGVSAQSLNAAINEVRKGRTADTASAEQGYDALKRYARDLTEAAAQGKIDPVIG